MNSGKILRLFLIIMALSMLISGCNGGNMTDNNKSGSPASPVPTEIPEDINPLSVDILTDRWVSVELPPFETRTEYKNGTQIDVEFYVSFTNRNTGTVLKVPGFWDGDNIFRCRFAPTEYGIWDYVSVCASDTSLDGIKGTVGANIYKGDLDIYKHGFLTVKEGNKYLSYADGTPFFYLGDTHWTYLTEEYEDHFTVIVDKRAEQGFTVYQSEPIDAGFKLYDGYLDKNDVKGFQEADRYYQYIAQKGLVHANAEFFFPGNISDALLKRNDKTDYFDKLCRYWVARFGSYPVIWTLGQEVDNDFYFERGDQKLYNAQNNIYIEIAKSIKKYDPYHQLLTAHQENVMYTTVSGKGTDKSADNNGKSAFYDKKITEETGHAFWAAQWPVNLTDIQYQVLVEDYWNSDKPSVNYEGRYCYLWTKDFGSRAQGWISFLSGFFGYGYGCADMWYYNAVYDMESDSSDGIETITRDDKKMKWTESINLDSAKQVCYMKSFLENLEWYNMVPDTEFRYFTPSGNGCHCTCASVNDDTCIIYFYSLDSKSTGKVNLEGKINCRWFNPRTGEYGEEFTVTDGNLSDKPDNEDWVIICSKIKK